MARQIIFLVVMVCFSIVSLYGQTAVSGKVTDEAGQPLPFANIFIKGSYDGNSTDESGEYSFTTTQTGTVTFVVSYVGYTTIEQQVELSDGELTLNFTMGGEVKELGRVVISAGSFEASDEKKSVILKPLDIATTAGALSDIYLALQTLPGTQVVGETEGLFVRGGSAAESKTIIDGMIVNSPFYSSVPDVPQRGKFSPFMFKGTIFNTGGYSARYGQALSSALILDTQDFPNDNYTALNLMAVGFGGSHLQTWENTAVAFEIGYVDLAPYFSLQDQITDWDEPPTGMQSALTLRQKVSETGLLKLYSTFETGDQSLNLNNIENPGTKDHFRLVDRAYYVNSSYRDIIGDDIVVQTGFSYSLDDNDRRFNQYRLLSDESLIQGRLSFSKPVFGDHILYAGADVMEAKWIHDYEAFQNEYASLYAAGFIEADIYLTNDLAARTGFRFEHVDLLQENRLSPRLSLAYRLGEHDQINAAYGHYYQSPDTTGIFNDRNLEFERADHYILAYQYLGDKYTFRIETYYKQYDDLLRFRTDNAGVTTYDNLGKGYARGIDIFWRDKETLSDVDYWISYSYLDTKREYRWFPTEATPDFAADHTMSFVLKHFIAEITTSFGLTYTFATGRPYYNPNSADFMSDRTKPYHNVSINASYLMNLWGNFTVVYASADNVLNIANEFGYRYSQDGTRRQQIVPTSLRTFFIGIFMTIGQTFAL